MRRDHGPSGRSRPIAWCVETHVSDQRIPVAPVMIGLVAVAFTIAGIKLVVFDYSLADVMPRTQCDVTLSQLRRP